MRGVPWHTGSRYTGSSQVCRPLVICDHERFLSIYFSLGVSRCEMAIYQKLHGVNASLRAGC